MTLEYLREKRKIVEMRNGCIYKTIPMGLIWLTAQDEMDQSKDGILFCTPSTSVPGAWVRVKQEL